MEPGAFDDQSWERDGFVRFPGFLGGDELGSLEAICETVVDRWYARHADAPWLYRTTNMSGLTDPGLFDSERELVSLLELIADARILAPLRHCAGVEPLFHNTQFFFEQRHESWDGEWHRDSQFDARSDTDERERMESHTGVHFRIAFARDPWLELVPGSHRRWDSPKEYAIRRSEEPASRASAEMPGRVRVELERGDALLFHAWGIHRGSYRTEPERRTLDLIYGWPGPSPTGAPQPLCFSDRTILDRLSTGARSFFERFVEAYEGRWPTD